MLTCDTVREIKFQFLFQPVATCCLFLAGKCEETPKKCRDIIRTIRQLTTDSQFETFGVDPDEEIMALERVLLQVRPYGDG